MIICKAYKVELGPTNKQQTLMERFAGTSRYVYNWGLAEWKAQYEAGNKPNRYLLCKQFNAKKDTLCPWIREVPYAVTESAFFNLGKAFENFFRRVKEGAEEKGYPKFKHKGNKCSFSVRGTKVSRDAVRVTGLGWIKLKEYDYIPENAKQTTYATISKHGGRWYISAQVEEDIPETKPLNGLVLGIDFGLKTRAVLSTGEAFNVPHALDLYDRQKKRLQRELARRKQGSSNWHKTKEKLARLEHKIGNVREWWLHQISHYITSELKPRVIVVEDLNVAGMLKNHHLSRAILNAGFGELRRQIEYKADWSGIEVIVAGRFFPSSKTCSQCGSVRDELSLSERTFICPDCGLEIDRDLNAALNLAACGQNREAHGDCLGS